MRLHKRTLRILVILLIVSLGGLVTLQYVLLTDAIRQREQTFRQNVHTAMSAVAGRLESHEAAGKIFKMVVSSRGKTPMQYVRVNVDSAMSTNCTTDSIILAVGLNIEPGISLRNDTLRYALDKRRHVTLRVYDNIGREDTILMDTFKNAGVYTEYLDNSKYSRGEYFYKMLVDSAVYTMRIVNGDDNGLLPGFPILERKKQLVGKVIENLTVAEREPVERRVQSGTLDSLIHLSLSEQGITLPYAFAVTGSQNDSLKIIQPVGYSRELSASEFKSPLFPGDFLSNGYELLLYFPGQGIFIVKQIGVQLALTILLTSILIFCFTYAVRTIVKQKEFALRLVEFINNMTHEFKTPISTISVAAETIMRQDVVDQKDKVMRYGSVIRDENKRMKSQVDKILQMAVLEEGDFELSLQPVDIHEIIAKAVEPITLQVEAKQGTVRYQLEAERSLINADPVHVTNVIHNVLENALKYSPDVPDIVVATSNTGNQLIVQVIDHGIGISKEEAKKVFDKYYRVPTGNRHDVKGFGLGLSYVKLMMTAHGGDASIAGEPGKGTTVTLTFPLANGSGE